MLQHACLFSVAAFLLASLTAVASPALAVGFGDAALPCDGPFDAVASESLHRGIVRPIDGERLHFVRGSQAPTCPSREAACRLPTYLVPGNTVLVSSADESFACVHYAGAQGKMTSGLVAVDGLNLSEDGDYALDSPAGLGTWSDGGHASITLKGGAGNGTLLIDGDATRGPPSYNSGELAGAAFVARGARNTAGYTDRPYSGTTPAAAKPPSTKAAGPVGCRVRLRRFGPYLVVDDNESCGGNGVTFSGVYVKR